MLKYLIIQLDDTSVSFCHYDVAADAVPRLIDLDTLKKAIFWSMTENLSVQVVYPTRALPPEYKAVIAPLDRVDIVSCRCEDNELLAGAEVVVFDSWQALAGFPVDPGQACIVRTTFADFFENETVVESLLPKVTRLNVVITDIERLDDGLQVKYKATLDRLGEVVKKEYLAGHAVQLNLLTDRMLLTAMNNCNSGHESITIGPDGRFYICPAFYGDADRDNAVGDIDSGLSIPNPQLYRPDHATICSKCDAWQCRRCVWLNRRLTLEVNTPGRQQCVTAHTERNASRDLLSKIRAVGEFLPDRDIPAIDYLDPFDKIINI